MQDIILAGSGGCMRELVWQIQELNKKLPTWNVIGYVDLEAPENGEYVVVGTQKVFYLGTDDILLEKKEDVNVAICVGSPRLRSKIVGKLSENPMIHFPNLILSNTYMCEDVKMGEGCIISMDARVSTNVILGNFVFLNTGAMVCHDGNIGDYVTLSPDVKLAGAVSIGDNTELGMGAKVIQGISICDNVIVGAGAVVVRDIKNSCTAVGVPAKAIK